MHTDSCNIVFCYNQWYEEVLSCQKCDLSCIRIIGYSQSNRIWQFFRLETRFRPPADSPQLQTERFTTITNLFHGNLERSGIFWKYIPFVKSEKQLLFRPVFLLHEYENTAAGRRITLMGESEKLSGSFSIFCPMCGYLVRLTIQFVQINQSVLYGSNQTNHTVFVFLTDILFVLYTEYLSQQTEEEQSVCKIVISFVINKKPYEFRILMNILFRTPVLTNEQSEQNMNNQSSKWFLAYICH